MLTHRRHRYLTRWPRRLAFALLAPVLGGAPGRPTTQHRCQQLGQLTLRRFLTNGYQVVTGVMKC